MKIVTPLFLLALALLAQVDPASEALQAWDRQHSDSDSQARSQALFEASAKWVIEWPDSRLTWEQRRQSLLLTQNHSPALWKQTDQNLIRLSPPHTFASLAASDWVALGINLDDAEALIASEIDWQDSQPRPAMPQSPSLSFLIDDATFTLRSFGPLCTLASAQIRLRKFRQARATVTRIRNWLDGDFSRYFDHDPFEAFPDYESRYLVFSAQLAQAEDKVVDALAFYQKLITNPWFHRRYGGYVTTARNLWKQAGGDEESWTQFAKVPAVPPGVATGEPGISFLPWVSLRYTLPVMKAAGPDCQTWTSEAFKGKATIVYLWASWCGPCWSHLPAVQALYDKIKDQSDFRLVTLSVDEDSGKLSAFMKEKGYTFPVVANKAYADGILPRMILGQHWIVDRSGSIRLQRTYFVGTQQTFINEAIYKLIQIAKAPSP